MSRNAKLVTGAIIGILLVAVVIFFATKNDDEAKKVETEEEVRSEQYSELVQQSCITCHATEDGKVQRISDIRKSPEGWEDTISRMQKLWGVDITPEQKADIVQELSEKNGLAPEETDKVMYWLTENGSTYESTDGDFEMLQNTCISCHAGGRPLAQYRTEDEWAKLKDFHIGMNPSTIYQMRTVKWEEESEEVLKRLASVQSFETEEWEEWKKEGKQHDVSGDWRVVGYQPGVGLYSGDATFEKKEDDQFVETKKLLLTNEEEKTYEGNVRLYTGYSLRSSLASGDDKLRGVFNVSKDGKTIDGRGTAVLDKGIYGDETYYRADEKGLLASWPQAVRAKHEEVIRLVGSQLPDGLKAEDFETPDHFQVKEVVKQNGNDVWIKVFSEAKDYETVEIALKDAPERTVEIASYTKIDSVRVEPEKGVARMFYIDRRQSTQFEAIGVLAGKDGKIGTDDDIEIGPLPVTWSLSEYEDREGDDDIEFAGTIDEMTGLFTPADGGLNEERPWSGNNAGNMNVHATYKDPVTGEEVVGDGVILVTVPDYMYIQ
ncbi:MAG TPA: quinohemoprotein amine dehydrogenase subunit alpha [Savagea sp.]